MPYKAPAVTSACGATEKYLHKEGLGGVDIFKVENLRV